MGGKILEYPTKTAWRQAVQQGMQQGMQQGIQQGEINKLIELIKKKMAKNYSVEQIADALEESVETIQDIIEGLKNDKG